jgi:hypothetical protein
MMTEQEAESKWCPMSRTRDKFSSTYGPSINRNHDGTIEDGCLCIASGCMMWRWARVRNDEFNPMHSMISMTPSHPADAPSPWKASDEEGYCGLAGRP